MKFSWYLLKDWILNPCLLTMLLLNAFIDQSSCQELGIKAGVYSFFDNREYFNYYENDQTIFGARAYANASIHIDKKNEFVIGLDGLYEFGSEFDPYEIRPIIYIHHKNELLDLYLGSFYRNQIINMPDVLLNDTIQYYKPNVEGIYISYQKEYFNHNLWIDWTSRQTDANKEIFSIGGSGAVNIGKFFYKHDLIITHHALTAKLNTNEHIRDNGAIYSRIGINSSGFLFFDSIALSTGIVFSYDRTRNITPLRYYKGSMTELCLSYKAFGLKYTNYAGTGQNIMTGNSLFEAKYYNRLDLIWKIFDRPGIEGEIGLSFYLINDFIEYSQKFTLRAEIDQLRNIKPKRL